MKKRFLALSVSIAVILSLFTGCQSGTKPGSHQPSVDGNSSNSTNVDGEVIDTSKDTLVFAADRETATLDNQAFAVGEWAQREIYEGLLQIEPDGSISPCLANKWEQIDDLTWKFYLRDDVTFHNGEHLKASDVIFTLKRTQEDPQVASTINFLDLENCVAEEDYVVVVKTLEPYALFEYMFAGHLYLRILNEKAVTDAGSADIYGRNPVGTGPYKFVSWTAGSQIDLTRFDEYWGEPAKIKNCTIRFITESTSRAIALEAGDVDIADNVSSEDVDRIANGNSTYLLSYTLAGARYLPLNCTHKYLDNPTVRLALRYATNVPELASVVWSDGTYELAKSTMIPPAILGHDDTLTPYEYDIEKAKELLTEAGYPDGFDLQCVYNGSKNENNVVFQLLQEYWAKVGVNLILNPTDSANLNTALNEGTYDTSLCTASVDVAEAGYMLGFWYSTARCGSGNRSWVSDEYLDEKIAELDETFDADARQEISKDIQQRVYELANVIVLTYPYENCGARSNVHGMVGTVNLKPQLHKCYFVVEQ